MHDLLLGARSVYTTPQIGDPSTTGTAELVHINFKYVEPFTLLSSLGMRLEIGFTDNWHPGIKSTLLVRVEAVSESEV